MNANLVNFLPMCYQKWTTTTYPKPKSLLQRTHHHVNLPETAPSPSPPVFFLDSLSSEAPGHQRCRCCCRCCWRWTGPALSAFCSPWGPQRWPAAPKASGPGVRQGQVPRRFGPSGVMGCTCSCGWVNRKPPLNWLMSTIGEFFWHDCARIHSNFDKVTSRWY